MTTTGMEKYPLLLRGLHWLIALVMSGMIFFGWYLSEMDYENPLYPLLRQWHRTIGLALFPLGIANLLAYCLLPRPAFSAALQGWEKALARLVHYFLLYVVIAIPVAGYLMSGDKLVIVGDTQVPALIDLSKTVRKAIFEVHELLAWGTAVIASLHGIAAIKHHVIDKNDTLKKML